MARRKSQRADIEMSIKEMIRSLLRFIHLLENDTLSGGICKAPLTKRLLHLEHQLQGKRKSHLSDERLRAIGRQVVSVVSEVCKSLIPYLSPYPAGYRLQSSYVVSAR